MNYLCRIILIIAILCFVSAETVFPEQMPESRKLTVEVKAKHISLVAENVGFKEALRVIAEKTGITIEFLDGVADRKVSVIVKDVPYFGISTLLEKMGLKNHVVAFESETGKQSVYIVNAGSDLSKLLKGKTVIREAHFAAKSDLVKGKEIITEKEYGAQYVKGEVLLKFHLGVTQAEVDAILKKHKLTATHDDALMRIGYIKAVISDGRDVKEIIKEVRKEYKLKVPEPNYVQKVLTVSDPLYGDQWYIPDTGFDKAWEGTKSTATVKVAIVDTGVQADHPDLTGKIEKGYDFVNNQASSADDNGHGTFVAGIIAANANSVGVRGLYSYARILPVKVIDANGLGTYEDAAKGIIYAADNGAQVINLSIGGYGYSQMLQDAVDYALEKGCILVAAGGNDGISKPVYPAAYPDVVGVAALDRNGVIWNGSNSGKHIKVSAPGVNIISTGLDSEYSHATGTSAAAPVVSALAAMLVSERADFPSLVIQRLITQSAKDLGEKGWDELFGSGEIDVVAALKQQVKPFHDVAVRHLRVEPMVFEKGKSTHILANIENAGTFKAENFDVVLYEIIGEEKKEIGKKEKLTVVDKTKVVFEWMPEELKETIKFEVSIIAADDANVSNNVKETNEMMLKEDNRLHVLYEVAPQAVHQWIALQAYNKLSSGNLKTEIANYLPTNTDAFWTNIFGTKYYYYGTNFMSSNDWDSNSKAPSSDQSTALIEGAWEEDNDDYGIGVGNDSFCRHFWDPTQSYDYGLTVYGDTWPVCGFSQNHSSLYQAQDWWAQALASYKLSTSDGQRSAYYYLGRVSHLLMDMSVPAHVLDDPHPIFDNYERYVKGTTSALTAGVFKRITSESVNTSVPTPVDSSYSTPGYDKKLVDLFYKLAEKANDYDSDDRNGKIDGGKYNHWAAMNHLQAAKTVSKVEQTSFWGTFIKPMVQGTDYEIDKYTSTTLSLPITVHDMYYYQTFYNSIGLTDKVKVTYTDNTTESFLDLLSVGTQIVPISVLENRHQVQLEASAIGCVAALYQLFWAKTHSTLSVTKNGAGSGTVTSNPSGINCGSTCTTDFEKNKSVVLTATPNTGSIFTGWIGGGCSGAGTCTVTMDAAKTVTAYFGIPTVTRTLTVASSNPGSGVSITVSNTDNNGQKNGTTLFTRTYNDGASVQLTPPSAAGGNNFSSWSGCNSTSGSTCNVTMNAAKTVTANYVAPVTPTITLTNPTTGATLTKGQNYTINWTSSSSVTGNVQIDLYKGASNYLQLAASEPNDGSYPFTPLSTFPNSSDYRVCISAMSGTVSNCSGYFTIKDGTAPYVTNKSYGTTPSTNIYVTFSKDMNSSLFTNSTVTVGGASSGNHSCVYSFNHTTYELTINPSIDFVNGEAVTVTIGTGVKDSSGNGLASQYAFSFNIAAATPPEPTSITVSENLNPSSTTAYSSVTVSGTATYNTGVSVASGTATITVGGNTWTAAVNNGNYSNAITAPPSSGYVSVSVSDGIRTSPTVQNYLTITEGFVGEGYALYRTTTSRDVESSDPYDPIYETEYFRRSDAKALVWIHMTDLYRPVRAKFEFYEPDGALYSTPYISEWTADPGNGNYYYWWKLWAWVDINGCLTSYRTGRWSCKIYIDDGSGWVYKNTENFTIGYEFTEHRMAKDVQTSDPYLPISETNIFYQTDTKALTWANADNVVEFFDVKWEYYEPNGSLYDIYTYTTGDPGADNYYAYSRFWGWILISGYSAANKTGDWHVDVSIKNAGGAYEKIYTDYFKIIENPAVAPVVTVANSPTQPVENSTVNINVSATDNSQLKKVVLHWNDGIQHDYTLQDNIYSNSYSYSYGLGSSFSANQQIEYWAEAWDTSGSRAESEHKTITILPETVTISNRPVGAAYLKLNQNGTYSSGGSTSSLGHSVQYQFDWGDGTQSVWDSSSQTHSWSVGGLYYVKTRARCQTHTNDISEWSIVASVTVDSTAPDTIITANPLDPFNSPAASFTFTSNEQNSTFECRIDNGSFSACTSPKAYDGLAYGSHTFDVRGTDPAGNTDATPATYTWTVDTVPPTGSVTINAGSTYINFLDVVLSLLASDIGSGASQMCISNMDTCTSWELFVTTKAWALTSGDGTKTVYVKLKDAAGNESALITNIITLDTTPPELQISALSDGSLTANPALNISGTVTDPSGIADLTINSQSVTVDQNGGFSYVLTLMSGANTITVTATDAVNNQTTNSRTVNLRPAITVTITAPSDNSKTKQSAVRVAGNVDVASTVTIRLNEGMPINAPMSGKNFALSVSPLVYGVNTIEVTASATDGGTSTVKRTITYDNLTPSVSITEPVEDLTTGQNEVMVRGSVADITAVTVTITVGDMTYTLPVTDGMVEQMIAFTEEGIYTVYVTATDELGNSATVQRNIIYALPKTLEVVLDPAEGGTVTGGTTIECPNACTETFDANSHITLTAQPTEGHIFTGWIGCDTTSGKTCEVVMSADKTVSASFIAAQTESGKRLLIVLMDGDGNGTITSTPTGINCNDTDNPNCESIYNKNSKVKLTAKPSSDSIFKGWSGYSKCEGKTTTTCTVTTDDDYTITAVFELIPQYTLGVMKTGNGTGTVTVKPGGTDNTINCTGDCLGDSASYMKNKTVTLTAKTDSGSKFTGWSGYEACEGKTTATCTVKMDADHDITSAFDEMPTYTVTVAPAGSGTGTITGSPKGKDGKTITCGTNCSADYVVNKPVAVTLKAKPAKGSKLTGWGGDAPLACTAKKTTCKIAKLDSDMNISAIFGKPGIEVSSTAVDVGTVAKGEKGTATFTVNNAGDSDLKITALKLSGDARFFKLLNNVTGKPLAVTTIAAGDSLMVIVSYTPASNKTNTAVLKITSDDPDKRSGTSITLTGTGSGFAR